MRSGSVVRWIAFATFAMNVARLKIATVGAELWMTIALIFCPRHGSDAGCWPRARSAAAQMSVAATTALACRMTTSPFGV